MTGVKAQWHLADVADEPDPFERAVYSTGVEIDLTGSEDELAATWLRLAHLEGYYQSQLGLTCELKDGGQDCLTCPVAVLDPAEPKNALCRLGKDQATVEQLCMAKTAERVGSCKELAQIVGPARDMVADTDELTDLLTAVGL